MKKFQEFWTPRMLSVLRIMTGLLFFCHGSQKVLGFPIPSRSPFDPTSLSGVAGLMELIGGFLIVIGLGTRWTSFLLSGLMAVAYFMAHGLKAFYPIENRGELAVLYCFIFLFFWVAGGGKWSVDQILARKKA